MIPPPPPRPSAADPHGADMHRGTVGIKIISGQLTRLTKMISDKEESMGKPTKDNERELSEAQKENALALETGKRRFGSSFQHIEVKNGICTNSLRKVIS